VERVEPIRSITKAYLNLCYKKVLIKDKKGKKKMIPVDSVQIGDRVYTLENEKWIKTTIR
jgi:hypothetical protein